MANKEDVQEDAVPHYDTLNFPPRTGDTTPVSVASLASSLALLFRTKGESTDKAAPSLSKMTNVETFLADFDDYYVLRGGTKILKECVSKGILSYIRIRLNMEKGVELKYEKLRSYLDKRGVPQYATSEQVQERLRRVQIDGSLHDVTEK